MKLYSFKPGCHGELSYFVMAKNETEARNKLAFYCEKTRKKGTQNCCDYRIGGTDYLWEVKEELLGVAENCND